jgi:hypothetical protein
MKGTVFFHRFVTVYRNNLGIPVFFQKTSAGWKNLLLMERHSAVFSIWGLDCFGERNKGSFETSD